MHPKKGRSKTSLIKAKKLVFELESLDLSLIFQLWKVGLVKRFQKRDRHQKTLLRCLSPTYNTQNAPFFSENWIKPNEALQLGGKGKIGIGR